MRIESKLCHFLENKAIVQVNGWINEKNVGSALGEASNAELAEDRAISRLSKRLKLINNKEENKDSDKKFVTNSQSKVQLPISEALDKNQSIHEPIDWSNDLAAIDTEIKRLNWSREDEIRFLKKEFGYNNRSMITKYNELINYLKILKNLDNIDLSNVRKKNLIDESEILLNELSWSHDKGREYLMNEFNVSTRKELNEKQLLSFVEMLKKFRNQYR